MSNLGAGGAQHATSKKINEQKTSGDKLQSPRTIEISVFFLLGPQWLEK